MEEEMSEETRYQRIAREQAERQAAREKRMKAASKPRRKRSRSYGPSYMHDTGPGFFRDPDGLDRDNLGASPDY
jgi:hypothetical protein